jgi:threonine/homoserine/homoserine lactone efflux protein
MEQFLMVATVHFLSLLSPGPDFMLIVRMSLAHGWRSATGACLGIALANGVFIVAAFTGLSVFSAHSVLFVLVQCVGGVYLLYLGQRFIQHATSATVLVAASSSKHDHARNTWWHSFSMGFMSAILNPKNALFYVSLASVLTENDTSTGWYVMYGVWMFLLVLVWDVLVAVSIGNTRVRQRFTGVLPWLERMTGAALLCMGLFVLAGVRWNALFG